MWLHFITLDFAQRWQENGAAMKPAYDCTRVVDIAEEPYHHLVIENQYVRAFAVEVPPRTRTLCHHHPQEYLIYVASGAEIVSAARGEEPKRLSYADGECELSRAGLVHVVDNLSDHAFRNVVVELLPGAMKLRRNSAPAPLAGDGKIDQLVNKEQGEILAIDLAPGAEVEIAGPAVLSAPYHTVMMREVDAYDIPLDGFRKLIWVCAPRQVGIRNPGHEVARMIVFQPGREG